MTFRQIRTLPAAEGDVLAWLAGTQSAERALLLEAPCQQSERRQNSSAQSRRRRLAHAGTAAGCSRPSAPIRSIAACKAANEHITGFARLAEHPEPPSTAPQPQGKLLEPSPEGGRSEERRVGKE